MLSMYRYRLDGSANGLRLSVAGISAEGNIFHPQPLHGFLDERIEPLAAFTQMMDDFLAHAQRPKFREMIGDPGDGHFMLLGREEFADLIGHID